MFAIFLLLRTQIYDIMNLDKQFSKNIVSLPEQRSCTSVYTRKIRQIIQDEGIFLVRIIITIDDVKRIYGNNIKYRLIKPIFMDIYI